VVYTELTIEFTAFLQAAIDHEADPWHCDTGLGDVRSEDDFASSRRRWNKCLVLLTRREGSIKRTYKELSKLIWAKKETYCILVLWYFSL
jgi:hypothetical protein